VVLEGGRIEQPEHPAEGVVAGDAVLQPQELPQQALLRAAKQRHLRCALRAAQRGGQRDDQKLHQLVLRIGCPRPAASQRPA
jgi:hypothetical protein